MTIFGDAQELAGNIAEFFQTPASEDYSADILNGLLTVTSELNSGISAVEVAADEEALLLALNNLTETYGAVSGFITAAELPIEIP